jgi:hypothetical protein
LVEAARVDPPREDLVDLLDDLVDLEDDAPGRDMADDAPRRADDFGDDLARVDVRPDDLPLDALRAGDLPRVDLPPEERRALPPDLAADFFPRDDEPPERPLPRDEPLDFALAIEPPSMFFVTC